MTKQQMAEWLAENVLGWEECLRMRSTLEEKAKQQRKQLNKDNK